MINKILFFISSRFSNDCNWTTGNCYYFAIILHTRFPNSEIWYDEINNHFVCKIDEKFYDWNGIYIPEHELVKWDDYKNIDELHYNRIIRDCIF